MASPVNFLRKHAGATWLSVRDAVASTRLRPFTLGSVLRGGYGGGLAVRDLRAGINVALVAFPQGMAYALIAGVPVEYGIFGSAIAAIIAPMLASSRLTILGPTNATAVLLATGLAGMTIAERVPAMALIVAMSGLFLIAGAFLKLSRLLQYISRTVMIGYMSAAAFLIVAKQLKDVFGYRNFMTAPGFFETLGKVFSNVVHGHTATILIACITALVYFLLMRRARTLPVVALTLALMSLLVWWLNGKTMASGIATLPPLALAQWPVSMPVFSAGAISQFTPIAAVLAFLCTLENSVMAKTLASRTGQRLDSDQEMLACGTANLACGFLGGMPASGSLTRSALNAESGACTPVSSIISGVLCALGGLLAGPLIGYVPLPSLAVLVVLIAISLIDPRQIRMALRTTKSDAAVLLFTFAGALLVRLDFGIMVGVATSIYLYLNKASRPELVEYCFNEGGDLAELEGVDRRNDPHISIVHAEGELFFGSAELFRSQVQRVGEDPNLRIIVLRMKNARHLDLTSVMAMEDLVRFLRDSRRDLIISGANKEVYRVLKNAGFIDLLGRENFFVASPLNPNVSTRNALKRAQEILGGQKAEVRIFYDPNKKTS